MYMLTENPKLPRDTKVFYLEDADVISIKQLLNQISCKYDSSSNPDFLYNAHILCHELPNRLKEFLLDFKLTESHGACVIKGFQIDETKIGDTPSHYKPALSEIKNTLHEELLLILCSSLLGEPYTWASHIRDRYFVHNILPVKGHEKEQVSSNSKDTLAWHSEDAFHPYRCDYIAFICLRNKQKVATTFSSINSIDLSTLDNEEYKALFEPRFYFEIDDSHKYSDDAVSISPFALNKLKNRFNEPLAVLFGSPDAPYINLDPLYMKCDNQDIVAKRALEKLIHLFNQNLEDLIMEQGDICFIDNYQAIHGRKPFTPKYDGKDRWLKRVFVTRDLRKSREARESTMSRVIY